MTKEERFERIMEAKELGLKSVTIDGVVYELGSAKAMGVTPLTDVEASQLVKPMSVLDDYSDDEILYWSTPHYDEIQAEKELREKQLKDRIEE